MLRIDDGCIITAFASCGNLFGGCLCSQDTCVRVRRQWQPRAVAARRRRRGEPTHLGHPDEHRARHGQRVQPEFFVFHTAFDLLPHVLPLNILHWDDSGSRTCTRGWSRRWCTGTSSRATSCWTGGGTLRSRTSASPSSWAQTATTSPPE